MKRNLPTEVELTQEGVKFSVRFEYDSGEKPWFDYRAGVGSPGSDPYVAITEVNFGDGWKDIETYPNIDFSIYEAEVEEILSEIEEREYDNQAKAEYEAWKEDKQALIEQILLEENVNTKQSGNFVHPLNFISTFQ